MEAKVRRRSTQAGATLVELVVGVCLTGILMTAVFNLLTVSLQARAQAARWLEIQQTARHAVDSMVRDIRYANAIIAVSPERVTIRTQLFGSDTITYWLDKAEAAAVIRQNKNANINQPVTGGGSSTTISVSRLHFETLRVNAAGQPLTVGIELTVTDLAADPAQRLSYTLSTAVTAMNSMR